LDAEKRSVLVYPQVSREMSRQTDIGYKQFKWLLKTLDVEIVADFDPFG